MRVLMRVRPGSDHILAGDAVQARATAAALTALGVAADLVETEALPDLAPYDVVHLFNLIPITSTHAAMTAARTAGKPIVLTPVFWDPAAFLDAWDQGGEFRAWWERTNPLRRDVLAAACVLLPNAKAELACLQRSFGALPPHRLVPNGVDTSIFQPRPGGGSAGEPHVLCVGRISARKNQLSLLQSLQGTGMAVHFLGPVNDFAYYRACRASSWPGVRFLPELSGRRLAGAYAAAPVHALVSWYETPGLASLEAAACGCRIVTTERGSAREYFGDYAWYCQPDDPAGIREAILAAMVAPAPAGLIETVRARFTWEVAARATLAGYEAVLARARRGRIHA